LIYPGNVNVNANVQDGYTIESLFSWSDDQTILSGSSNIGGMAGSYGGIGLNSNAANTGANSNKNADWNGHTNSGVTAGTDGLIARTAWEAPIDSLPSV
jgi:hypothetical protein